MDRVDIAIMRLREASQMSQQIYGKPLVVTTSGGKDSSVCLSLAEKSGIPFEVLHSHTTVDAPETVYFVRKEFERLQNNGIQCKIDYPVFKGKRTSMWDLIPKKLMPPVRWSRYCCEILKEQSCSGRFIVTGVRKAESVKRSSRGIYEKLGSNIKSAIILNNDNDDRRTLIERCTMKSKMVCNPIIDWSDRDVWDFIHSEKVSINPLYNTGHDRIGCIGCPMAGTKKRQFEFAQYPKYKKLWIFAFDKMIQERKKNGLSCERETGEDLFHLWMDDGILPGQISMF